MGKSALVLVDIQNDFVPGGPLATKNGDEVVSVANRLQPHFDVVVATQDWHPPNHGSFASNHPGKSPGEFIDLYGIEQILWPDHCVQGSEGAELHPDLETDRIEQVIRKGEDPKIDSYSGFFDNGHLKETGLEKYLRSRNVDDVYICGLATDYCVKYTVLDSAELGFDTKVVLDGCRGVELEEGDIDKAVEEMKSAGVTVVMSDEVIEKRS
ncbi:MAG: bifunctional nicotinamidase/pyrazinamidase [Thermoanaerobaculia bacterium]|nr:bifunctional nicotinamidase/pyrazinamidase [Thermoanaerobaculia bacterium]